LTTGDRCKTLRRGAEVEEEEDEEDAAAAAAEAGAIDLGISERVRCTHEYCGVCGTPWLDNADVASTASGVCQVDQSAAVNGLVGGLCCGGDEPHWLSWKTLSALSAECDVAEGRRRAGCKGEDGAGGVDFATRYNMHHLLQH